MYQADIQLPTTSSGRNCWSLCDYRPDISDSADAGYIVKMFLDPRVQISEPFFLQMTALRTVYLQQHI